MCHHDDRAINPIAKAVAILRRYADTREIPEDESAKISHYAMLHAQEKGISPDAAYQEIARQFQLGDWSASPEPPSTEIHSHVIGIVTDPIPAIRNRAENGIAKITDSDYIASLHRMVRAALERNKLGHLSAQISVHPIEVRTNLPGTSDYLHIVELAGEPDFIAQIALLWPTSTHLP
jgi:hypothetical protein